MYHVHASVPCIVVLYCSTRWVCKHAPLMFFLLLRISRYLSVSLSTQHRYDASLCISVSLSTQRHFFAILIASRSTFFLTLRPLLLLFVFDPKTMQALADAQTDAVQTRADVQQLAGKGAAAAQAAVAAGKLTASEASEVSDAVRPRSSLSS